MPIGTAADFVIYPDQYYGGMYEAISQNTNVFNEASSGTLIMAPADKLGDYAKEEFVKRLAGLINRRDTTSVAAVADINLTGDEFVSVKINRRVGPVAETLDVWKKLGEDPGEFSFQLGRQVGEEKLKDMVNTGLLAVETALQAEATVVTTFATTAIHTHLVDAMAKLGDASGSILAWVMHSKVWHDLIKQAVVDKIFGVANIAIYEGTTATFGRPVIVTDAPCLVDAGTPNTYNTLGLTAAACVVNESEQQSIVSDMITGLAQLVMRIQGEYAFNVGVKGYKYDTAAGANPTDTVLGTASSWTRVVASVKNGPGIKLVTQ